MPEFTLNDLVDLLRKSAGEDESVDLNGDILDNSFEELGYDSLALLNLAGYIKREYGVELDEKIVSDSSTPRALLAGINDGLGQLV